MDGWWAFSKEKGWVVIDRDWPGNEPGSPDPWIIVRCADWSVFTEMRSSFPPPGYQYVQLFLKTLADRECKEARDRLVTYQAEYKKRCEHLQTLWVRERHQKYMASIGQESEGIRESRRERRITTCWNCKHHLDSAIHLECIRCRWIVCWHCSACGCGYPYRNISVSYQRRPI